MSGKVWTKPELKKLRQLYRDKPAWVLDYEYSALLAPEFKRSPESVRWQLRQLRRDVSDPVIPEPPKILLMDIETLPIEALVWDTWKQTIYMEQIKKDWSVLCWSAKWLFDAKVMGQAVRPDEAILHNDASVLQGIWNLLNEAHIVITHNGDEFDIKKLNARFFQHGYPKPMYFKSIDTKKVAKEELKLTYNKLDWIAQVVGIGRKVETDFKWWKECEQGNQKYIDMMLKYNKHDVHLEEEVYLKLRPWMSNHPNMNLHSNQIGDVCPACGCHELDWGGQYSTGLGTYKAFRCQKCGAIGRGNKKIHKIATAEVK